MIGTGETMRNKTVLVVDDEAGIRSNLMLFLRMEGYVAREAADGAAGLASVASVQPDLIICDVMMPEIDGFTFLKQLRENPLTSNIPLIFLTASAEQEVMQAALASGAGAYLSKPFKLAQLRALIERLIGK